MKWCPGGKGLQYREHPTRKYGVRADRYYRGRYRLDGKLVIVVFGWESENVKRGRESFHDSCMKQLLELKSNAKGGKGPTTIRQKREEAERQRQEQVQQAEREEAENISFADFFEQTYWPITESSKKPESYRKEREHFENWIKPVLGDLPFKDISQIHVEKIKQNMQKTKRSWRSIEYVLSTFRQIWNLARDAKLTAGESPSKRVKIHKPDNDRRRYLTNNEAELLLDALEEKSLQVYQVSLLSLDTGGRFSEIARLTWGAVDLDKGVVAYWDAKMSGGTKSRVVPMTDRVRGMFREMEAGRNGDLIFPDKKGRVQQKISHSFYRAVNDLKLNEGVSDPRDKVVYHTLRHTYASRLVQSGVGLYRVQRLLGHSVSKMTERYSHLSSDTLSDAVKQMERVEKEHKARENKGNVIHLDQ